MWKHCGRYTTCLGSSQKYNRKTKHLRKRCQWPELERLKNWPIDTRSQGIATSGEFNSRQKWTDGSICEINIIRFEVSSSKQWLKRLPGGSCANQWSIERGWNGENCCLRVIHAFSGTLHQESFLRRKKRPNKPVVTNASSHIWTRFRIGVTVFWNVELRCALSSWPWDSVRTWTLISFYGRNGGQWSIHTRRVRGPVRVTFTVSW